MKHVIYKNLIFTFLLKTPILSLFISLNLYGHPHMIKELQAHPHMHAENGDELFYDLNNFNDLEEYRNLKAPDSENTIQKKKIIQLDDNLYLLDEDFNLDKYDYELEKIDLNPNDLETAKEYEDLLNAFYSESKHIGSQISTSIPVSIKPLSPKFLLSLPVLKLMQNNPFRIGTNIHDLFLF